MSTTEDSIDKLKEILGGLDRQFDSALSKRQPSLASVILTIRKGYQKQLNDLLLRTD